MIIYNPENTTFIPETNDPLVYVRLDFELPWKLIFMSSW